MFEKNIELRLDSWKNLRRNLEDANDPLQQVWDFWHSAPFIPYNTKINPYNPNGWPTPWEIIADNHYDDFTRALLIGWTLKLTSRYQDSAIFLKLMIDTEKKTEYNLVYVDDTWVINYNDNGPITTEKIPASFRLENIIELKPPR